nr:type I polyketide synthase [Mycobacterium conspicuum]
MPIESSLPVVLRGHASRQPDEPAFTYVDFAQDWEGVPESLTWSQLYRRTLNMARELRSFGSTGDRVVISAPQGLDYVVGFLGALQAGMIAVPLSEPVGGSADERVHAVLRDAAPTAILTSSSLTGHIAEHIQSKPGESAPSIVELDSLDLDSPDVAAIEVDSPPSIAHLQYTSGSTRTPAGVMMSHENIVANYHQLAGALFVEQGGVIPPDTSMVSWVPLFHDMGLVLGIVMPVLGGNHCVFMSPASFLQRPARWMQFLARNGRVFTAAPNVGFELAARKTSDDDLAGLDLGAVHTIVNGSERVQPATLRRFAERFAPFNLNPKTLRPSYGLAEATLYVASGDARQPPDTVVFESAELTAGHAKRSRTGEGTPLVTYRSFGWPTVRIVDPETRTEQPDGRVGELWVHGDNVASGYWQKPEETERTFGATLVNPSPGTPEAPWLRTGDLGFLSEGELFLVGRMKDLLIVYGRNHSPDDIEETIQAITRNRCVAIAVPDAEGVEQLVTIVELKMQEESEEAAAQRILAVRRDITAAISKSHGLSVADLVLVRPGSIPLTTSGKVRRRDCLKVYQHNEFTRIDESIRALERQPVPDATDTVAEADSGLAQRLRALRQQHHQLLVAEVCAQAATVLGHPTPDRIDPKLPFLDLGFDSIKATELLDRLNTVTELDLPLTLAFDYPTPDELATHLSQLLGGSASAAAATEAQVRVDEPIAVVGMACRFPGGVDSPAGLWELVAGGIDAVGEFPADRGWNLADLFDPDPDAVGKTYTRTGGFLADAAGFDADFFGISGREAQSMDPQQRLLLEVCWEALEAARIDPAGLVGSDTGVFVGAWSQTYGAGGSDSVEGYGLTGSSTSVASGRVAYALGLQGPAITVDTACSSSLVSTHLACQSLLNGESTLALAGGATVMTTPAIFTEFARQRGLAADGRCKTFSANADGTGWGEGAAVLVLERLSDAQRNGHPVLAVIAGSAINQDGASNGLTAPNGPSQQRVITQAVANAGIGLDQVDVVEAHGTGTTLGDPIEAGALIATYGAARGAEQPLWLGSIKSNIGHTQAAAGAAGIIKMVAALNHDTLPPTLHVDRPSPHIDWSAGTVRLLTEPVAWPVTDHPRTAAVSSFGISGTNAHLILQQAPSAPTESAAGQAQDAAQLSMPAAPLWPVSARTPAALRAQADRLHHHLTSHPDLDLADVAYSLATTRTHHPYRATITAPTAAADPRKELLDALDALRAGQPHPQLTQHHFLGHLHGKTVFVLPGQGGQYPGMGRELYEQHRVFADTVDDCDNALRPYTGWSVRDVLLQAPGAPALDRVDVVQPVLFTMMVALADVLGHYGVVPDAVIGHSQGEIAAAYIAGVLPLPEAAKVVALRSQALSALRGTGGMASVLLGADALRQRLQPWAAAVSIAAINGPTHTIISGDPAALEEFAAACERDGIHIRLIAVDYASHSAQVEAVRERLLAELADLTPAAARIPLYSTVGQALSADPLDTETMDADYWYRNLREPVRFYDTVVELLGAGECTFVELSPHPVLAPAITDTLAQATDRAQSAVITTLHRDHPDQDNLVTALAALQNHGHSPSWPALYPHARTVELPTYAFEHRRYWMVPAMAGDARGLGLDGAEHPLLGAVAELADEDQIVISGRLGAEGWLSGHRVNDTVLFPATGFVEVALRAGELSGCPVIDELVLHTALTLSEQAPSDLQILVQPLDEHGRREFSVHSRSGGQPAWTLHASGALSAEQPAARPAPVPAVSVPPLDEDDFYEPLAQRGYGYGGLFRSLRGIGSDPARPDVVCAEVALPAGTDVAGYGIHPALLDAALHPLASALDDTDDTDDADALRLPYALSGITLHATAATQLHVQLTPTGADTFALHATDPAGAPVITIASLTLRAVPDQIGRPASTAGLTDGLFELTWPLAPELPEPAGTPPTWAVYTESPEQLPAGLSDGTIHTDLATLTPCPELVIWPLPQAGETDPLDHVHALTRQVLAQLQGWLARPDTANTRLIVVTRHAVSVGAHDDAPDLAPAAAWALLHTAQNENPDRLVLLDTDDTAATEEKLLAVIAAPPADEPQLALRNGVAHMPRLARTSTLTPPDAPDWQLATTGKGDLTNLTLLPTDPPATLAPGQIRVQVRAAGLNFHDVVVALGAIGDEGLGGEAAGVVVDTGPGVTGVKPGDAVMGLFPNNAFAPTAITDEHTVVPVPDGWSFAQAASVPVAFLTAYIALVDIGGLSAGQRVLIHAGTGGVGQAAIQIARHLGAEVFATAHPNKQHVLTGLGLDADHIASSRTLAFADAFGAATVGQGVDVVLNSLRGEFVDASLRLLPRGGAFVEIGKTDVRAAGDIAASHPGVAYHAFDLAGATTESVRPAWAALTEMFAAGALTPLPTTSYGLTNAIRAFRDMSQARHTGKIVLIPPAVLNPEGTALITGGTGMLGAVFAEHLITRHGIKHLLLLSRRGPDAPGAGDLHQRLTALGAHVTITACDIGNAAELAAALDTIAAEHPLTAVLHATGVLDDAVVSELTPAQLDAVLAAKADAAWQLHRLTAGHDLAAFVLFSSVAGTLGGPGQANYAAANAVLDALAHQRQHTQRPAISVAWGYWETPTGMTAHLNTVDLTRLTASGVVPITSERGRALFDAALNSQQPNLMASPLNTAALTRQARNNVLDPMLSGLVTSRRQAAGATSRTLVATLATQTPEQRLHTLTAMVTATTAAVLAHPDPSALDPDRPFKDLGIDSLTALELRNTLNRHTGLTLPATLAFDHPSPTALAHHLTAQLGGTAAASPTNEYVRQIQELVTSIPASRLEEADILALLRKLASSEDRDADHEQTKSRLADMDADDLIAIALKTRGNG